MLKFVSFDVVRRRDMLMKFSKGLSMVMALGLSLATWALWRSPMPIRMAWKADLAHTSVTIQRIGRVQ